MVSLGGSVFLEIPFTPAPSPLGKLAHLGISLGALIAIAGAYVIIDAFPEKRRE